MRHRIAGGQLNRTGAHRIALRRNMAASLFEHETISTTLQKAKHVRSFAEKLITLAKKGDLAARRRAISLLGNRNIDEDVNDEVENKGTVINKLFSEIAPRYLDRPGGYTRIIRLSKNRLGDNGQLVLLQLVGAETKSAETKGASSKAKNIKADKTVDAELNDEPVEQKANDEKKDQQ